MKSNLLRNVMHATRLVRDGKLSEATAILRGHQAAQPERRKNEYFDAGAAAKKTSPFFDQIGNLERQLDGIVPAALKTGHVPVPPGARYETHAFANQAGRREYKLYVPSRAGSAKMPLVVMLHGCTQNPDDFAIGTQMNNLAEEKNFVVAYPAQTKSANAHKCWNWFNPADQTRDAGEPSLIAGLTSQIIREAASQGFAIDSARVYIAGLSAGGAAAAVMGVAYPDLFAAVGIHSGLACGAARDATSAFAAMRSGSQASLRDETRQIPAIVFHGDADKTVNPVNGTQAAAQFRGAQSDLHCTAQTGKSPGGLSYTRAIESDASGLPIVERWTVHGAGHAWSGGNPRGSYADPRGPDASREMIRFFLSHQKMEMRDAAE